MGNASYESPVVLWYFENKCVLGLCLNEFTFSVTHMSAGMLSHNSGSTFRKALSQQLTLFVFGIISNESSTDRIS